MGVQRPQVLTSSAVDVVVVGGGPAGLIAGRDLAAAGVRVVVFEEHEIVGAPVHCTGVLGMGAFDELDLPRETILTTTQAARFVSANGSTVVIDAERVRAAVIDRARFDASLAGIAIERGATVCTGARVERIAFDTSGVSVVVSGSTVRSRAVVLACGASYRFNRGLGFGVPRMLGQSAQIEVPFPAAEHVEVHFGRAVAPGGFAWVVPFRRGADTFARVGLFCDRGARNRFHTYLERVRQTHRIEGAWPAPRLKALPLGPVPRTYATRALAIGDAAGLVKPTTGGGIYYGLLTGALAADVLVTALRADRLDASHLKAYERRWRARLWPEIRAGLAFRAVASRLSDGAIDTLMELARVDGIVPLLKQTADFNWHGAAARALLRNASFRRVVFGSLWS